MQQEADDVILSRSLKTPAQILLGDIMDLSKLGIQEGQLIVVKWKPICRALGDCGDYRTAEKRAAHLGITIVYLGSEPAISVKDVIKNFDRIVELMEKN